MRDESYLKFFLSIIRSHSNGYKALEIRCNNGELLSLLKSEGFDDLIGIDPTVHGQERDGISFHRAYWSSNFASTMSAHRNAIPVIIARHVLEHVPDPDDFIKSFDFVSNDETTLFIEVPDFEQNLLNAGCYTFFFRTPALLYSTGVNKKVSEPWMGAKKSL
ncbi:MAG: methyltransferase domain-containing protein [Bdellovibrionales bacterium]